MGAASGVGAGGGGGAPLSASIIFSVGTGPFNVPGASGDLYTTSNGVISVSASGGSGSYTSESTTVHGDPSGKISVVAASDHVHNTLGYSGFILNETEGCYIQYDVTDSLGATASDRYPPVGQIIAIKRAS